MLSKSLVNILPHALPKRNVHLGKEHEYEKIYMSVSSVDLSIPPEKIKSHKQITFSVK